MFWNDIVYVVLLLLCIALGPLYRKIEDPITRKWTSTLFGLILVFGVSGSFVIHSLFSTLVNAIVITQLPWKTCHLISFYFSFFYLLVIFRLGDIFGLPEPPTHTNLIQMILTLKLAGLAFEINSAATAPPDDLQGLNSPALKKITILDVFHYAFSHMGVLTGPYYRYRTYWDSFHRPFSEYVDPWPLTFYKLKQAVAFGVLFLIMDAAFPVKYVVSEEYAELPLFYRFLYMYPAFATFRCRMYVGMLLSESVCQMSGMGAYPSSSEIIPGLGPKDYKVVEKLSKDTESLKKEELDFETVHNMNIYEVETTPLVRTTMKVWNTCIQYWMAVYVYKRFPLKSLRVAVTLALSALWHGYAAGYYFCICQVALYLPLEDICVKFYKQTEHGLGKKAWGFALWYMKLTCMAYFGVPFLLLDFNEIIHFYKSLYFSLHFVGLAIYITLRVLKPYYVIRQDTEKKHK